jgi:glycosyltransferase involved in cell wall biosynthesis
MKILYVVPRYWPSIGGAQLHSREFIYKIFERHDVRVVTQFTADKDTFLESVTDVKPERYQDGDITVFNIGPRGISRPILQTLRHLYGRARVFNPLFAHVLRHTMVMQLKEIADAFAPDILHAVHIGLVYSSEAGFQAAQRFNIPFVWTPVPHIEGNGWKHRRFKRLYRASDAVIAMTEREKTWLTQQGAPEGHVHVIPVGPILHPNPNGDLFRKNHNLGHSPVVLFLGQKLAYKGYRQLLDAAPRVWARIPDARFLFIGPRMEGSEVFFQQVKDSRIIELPAVDLLIKTSALAACDIFCMPSTQESLGGVYLEAWSFRKPVIAARIAIMEEVVDNGKDGLLVEQTPQSIADAIITLLTDKAMREMMGETGYRKVQEAYRWEALADRLELVYRQLSEH